MEGTGQIRLGVDVGGTFTDVILTEGAATRILKVPTSSPASEAIVGAIRELLHGSSDVEFFAHATTLLTNALLTGRGLGKTALITNEGFTDVIEIGRQRRPEPYNIDTRRPKPLVGRDSRFGIKGRISSKGEIVEKMDAKGARNVARKVKKSGYESLAVCFLNSYTNPIHEVQMKDILRTEGFTGNVSLSSEVDRAYREYERTSTTVVNACLIPPMSGYLTRLRDSIGKMGIFAPVQVMSSDGGMSTSSSASVMPVRSVESGPAAGVIACRHLARLLSMDRVLTFDMGGTTAKAGAVIGGEAEVVEEFEAAGMSHSGRSIRGSGYPIRGRFIDLAEVSAGGGTVAWVDDGGQLNVGPRSAGSSPGPACYGRGGTEPTVTDANVVLGRMNPSHLLNGAMKIHHSLSSRAISTLETGVNTIETAVGIIRIANDIMRRAISIVSSERGRDPREFSLFAFGGAGPLHACDLAEQLGIRKILVPAHPGLFSAQGLLTGGITKSFVRPVSAGVSSLPSIFRELDGEASREMRREGSDSFTIKHEVELRYRGQAHEIPVEYRGSSKLRRAFDDRHASLYGYKSTDPIEAVAARATATVPRGETPMLSYETKGIPKTRSRRSMIGDAWGDVAVLGRDGLGAGEEGTGPCIIEEYDSTMVVNSGWRWQTEHYGTLMSR